jgi:hypothetical protein
MARNRKRNKAPGLGLDGAVGETFAVQLEDAW